MPRGLSRGAFLFQRKICGFCLGCWKDEICLAGWRVLMVIIRFETLHYSGVVFSVMRIIAVDTRFNTGIGDGIIATAVPAEHI